MMKVVLDLQDNVIVGYSILDVNECKLDYIEVAEENVNRIVCGSTKYVNGKFDFSNDENYVLEQKIRYLRNEECFPIINRGQLWYNGLTQTQKDELAVWYQNWLDAPQTKQIPKRLEWL